MELIWFEDYLALAETLNFSRAAELRHVTQPAFSRRIRALEAWVGTDLFARTTHGVSLTPAGEHFHDQAEVLTRALHQLRRDTIEVSDRRARPLSIAATHALSFTFFPQWVRRNDSILALGNLNLISDSMQACEQMMLRGDAQFLLCHHHKDARSRIESGQFRSIVVGADTLVPLSAPSAGGVARWRLDGGEPVKYLAYSAQSGLGRIVAARWGAKDRAFRAGDGLHVAPCGDAALDGARGRWRGLAAANAGRGRYRGRAAGGSRQRGTYDPDRNPAVSSGGPSEQGGRSDLVGFRAGMTVVCASLFPRT